MMQTKALVALEATGSHFAAEANIPVSALVRNYFEYLLVHCRMTAFRTDSSLVDCGAEVRPMSPKKVSNTDRLIQVVFYTDRSL